MTVVISATELRRLTQQIQGQGMEQKLRQMKKEDREERFRLSRARVQNWDNTIAGQRRKKLEAREERFAKEEAERVKLDQEYAEEEAMRRKQAIDRAKRLQYFSQDPVRAFHSRVLLHTVLQERDLQVEMRQNNKYDYKDVEQQYVKDMETRIAAETEAEAAKDVEARARSIRVAQGQLLQIKEKLSKDQEEKMAEIREGMELKRLDSEYKQEQKKLEEHRKNESLQLREQLLQMRQDLKNRAASAREHDSAENERIQAWIARKSKQLEMKKEVEKKWFEDSLKMRDKIGEIHAKFHIEADSKLEEQIAKAVGKKEEQARLEEKERQDRKKKQQDELKKYFIESQRQAEERKQEQKAQEKLLLEYYMKVRDEAVREAKEKKANILREGKELQEHHLSQMEVHRIAKLKEKEERLEYDKHVVEISTREGQDLKDYMKSVAAEHWALPNSRLQKYVNDTLNKKKRIRFRNEPQNTRDRLGFVPGGYTKQDMARMNPVVTGSYLKMIGNKCFEPYTPALESENGRLKALAQDTLTTLLDKKQAARAGISTEDYDKRIKEGLKRLKDGVMAMEIGLETAEQQRSQNRTPDLKKWENAILELSKQCDRLEIMAEGGGLSTANGSALLGRGDKPRNPALSSASGSILAFKDRPEEAVDLSGGELVQLQQRIIDGNVKCQNQDSHLDQLSETIQRQREIGIMIGNELDSHVDLLQEVEENVDDAQSRLGAAGRRLREVHERAQSASAGNCLIVALVCVLVVVIVWAKWK
ncbi:hypothetical protein HDU76_000677 [Blyttiomyces sp. JEL0837]|nr:hypothetical protein HDU76_000677 [Blyttiomyces sp. JEL0837]